MATKQTRTLARFMLAPSVVLLLVWMIVPLVMTLWFSFQNYSLINPMMTGFAQFGPVEMGGMFSVVKVREGLARDDYKDPGWFEHPPGTVAYEWTGEPQNADRVPPAATDGASGW